MMNPQRSQKPEPPESIGLAGAVLAQTQQPYQQATYGSASESNSSLDVMESSKQKRFDDNDSRFPRNVIEKPCINNLDSSHTQSVSPAATKTESVESDGEAKAKQTPPQHLLTEEERPKRPLSAYNLFFQEQRKRILESTPVRAEGKPRRSHGKMGFASMAKTIAAAWNSASPAQKIPFEKLAREEKARYKKKAAAWKKRKQQREEALKAYGVTPPTQTKKEDAARPKTSHIPFSAMPALSAQTDATSTLLSVAVNASGDSKKAASPRPQEQDSSSLLLAASQATANQEPSTSPLQDCSFASASSRQTPTREEKSPAQLPQQGSSLLLAASQASRWSELTQRSPPLAEAKQDDESILLAAAGAASSAKPSSYPSTLLPQKDSSLLLAASQAARWPELTRPAVAEAKQVEKSLLLAAACAVSSKQRPSSLQQEPQEDNSSIFLAARQARKGWSQPPSAFREPAQNNVSQTANDGPVSRSEQQRGPPALPELRAAAGWSEAKQTPIEPNQSMWQKEEESAALLLAATQAAGWSGGANDANSSLAASLFAESSRHQHQQNDSSSLLTETQAAADLSSPGVQDDSSLLASYQVADEASRQRQQEKSTSFSLTTGQAASSWSERKHISMEMEEPLQDTLQIRQTNVPTLAMAQAASGVSELQQKSDMVDKQTKINPSLANPLEPIEGSWWQHNEESTKLVVGEDPSVSFLLAACQAASWTGQDQAPSTCCQRQQDPGTLLFAAASQAATWAGQDQAAPNTSQQNFPEDDSLLLSEANQAFWSQQLHHRNARPNQTNTPLDASSLVFATGQASSWPEQQNELQTSFMSKRNEEKPSLLMDNQMSGSTPHLREPSIDALMSEPIHPFPLKHDNHLHYNIGRLSSLMEDDCVTMLVDMFRNEENSP